MWYVESPEGRGATKPGCRNGLHLDDEEPWGDVENDGRCGDESLCGCQDISLSQIVNDMPALATHLEVDGWVNVLRNATTR